MKTRDVSELTNHELTTERRALFGYTDPEKVVRSREVCDEIIRRSAARSRGHQHGDTGTCKHCGQPVEFWDRNPNHIGALWLHTGRTYGPNEGRQPQFCNETKAEVDR